MRFRRLTSLLAAVPALGALAVPATGSAATGGATTTSRSAAAVARATTLWAPRGALVHRAQTFHGFLPRRAAGRTVLLQGRLPSSGWRTVATARTGARGGYAARWTPEHLGRYTFRALPAGSGLAASTTSAPHVSVTVFLPAVATWYGPGFYGKRTACGTTLSRATLGVAHRWLKCGTKVALLYHGRTITVPVIDRGPFGNGASWDLTSATAQRLGMSATSHIGAVSLRGDR